MTRKRADIRQHGQFNVDPERYASVAQHQRQFIRAAADRIEAGESFHPLQLEVAAALRARAAQPWRGRRPSGAAASREPERDAIRAAADSIEAGEPFNTALVAKALRAWAKSLKPTPRPRRGQPPTVDHAAIALEWELGLRRGVLSGNKLRGQLAEKYGVDESTIKEAVNACGAAARRHFDALAGLNTPE